MTKKAILKRLEPQIVICKDIVVKFGTDEHTHKYHYYKGRLQALRFAERLLKFGV